MSFIRRFPLTDRGRMWTASAGSGSRMWPPSTLIGLRIATMASGTIRITVGIGTLPMPGAGLRFIMAAGGIIRPEAGAGFPEIFGLLPGFHGAFVMTFAAGLHWGLRL